MPSLLKFLVDGGETSRLVPLKFLYFIHYMAFSTQTFLPMYFDTQAGFDKMQIGVLLALPCICSIVSPPLWGAATDISHNQKLVHIVCVITAALFMFLMQYVHSFVFMCVVFFVANFQIQPTYSLLDQVAMQMLDRIGGDYGKQRLYGAMGYGLGGYLAGVIAALIGIAWCFNMVVALSCVSLYLIVHQIPSFERKHVDMDFVQGLKCIVVQKDVLILFILVVVIGIVAQLIDSFLFLYYFNLTNNNSNFVGIVIVVETISEWPLFFYANKIIHRYGTTACIYLGIAAYAVRLFIYSVVENPWIVLPIEALHGITFGLVWAAFTNYIYASAPAGTEGTMIGLLASIQKGIGGGAGTLIGGWIYEQYGARVMWSIALFGVLPVAVVVAIAFSYAAKVYDKKDVVVDADELLPLHPLTPSFTGVSPRTAPHTYNEVDLIERKA